VDAAELEKRRAAFEPPALTQDSGWLSIYQRTALPLSKGASLIPKARQP